MYRTFNLYAVIWVYTFINSEKKFLPVRLFRSILLFFQLVIYSILPIKLGCQPRLLTCEIMQNPFTSFQNIYLGTVLQIIVKGIQINLYYYFHPIRLLNIAKKFHPIPFFPILYVYYIVSKIPQLYYYLVHPLPILLLNFEKNSNLYFYSGLYVYSELQSKAVLFYYCNKFAINSKSRNKTFPCYHSLIFLIQLHSSVPYPPHL